MFPAANVSSAAIKPVQPAPPVTAQKTTQPQAPETARASSGESAAANVKAETSLAVQAPEQTSVAPRLRDQETSENTDRALPEKDDPTGPPPTFEESLLERQARVAFDPPDLPPRADELPPREPIAAAPERSGEEDPPEPVEARQDPPPTPTEKAEVSFTETKALAEGKEPATVDVRG